MPRRCVFCDILEGTEPASFVHQDDHVVAFMDLFPWRPGHTLVIPHDHAQHVHEMVPHVRTHLWQVATSLADAVREGMQADAVHFLINDGVAAFQSVPHVHLHIVPRYKGDGVAMVSRVAVQSVGLLRARRATLDAYAERIRDAYAVR